MRKSLSVDQPNLSLAWAEAFCVIRDAPGHRIAPLTLTFSGFADGEPEEVLPIRSALDGALKLSVKDGRPLQSVQTVANTIFPQVLWERARGDRQAFYTAYRESLPDYVSMDPVHNKRGLYFGRLIAFGLDHKTGEPRPQFPKGSLPEDGNQIERIITLCKKGAQTIKLQANVFDAARDHVPDARLGFPCLQHVTFVPDFDGKSLVMNAFYATQQLFVRAYGNYLGLARLGLFVADQVGLALEHVTCFVGVEKMDDSINRAPRAAITVLSDACEAALAESDSLGSV